MRKMSRHLCSRTAPPSAYIAYYGQEGEEESSLPSNEISSYPRSPAPLPSSSSSTSLSSTARPPPALRQNPSLTSHPDHPSHLPSLHPLHESLLSSSSSSSSSSYTRGKQL
ncbi:hypothetical protein CSUI_006831 [Cystoisospora suis]|uniref:Uncharacterized protein n=1 Tax=Cystoisospora suis TaxID=483139 RepID=A0A2C6KP65_9APIC|nr:hypothetical protein CSUI_006831 [Cystoisospora suis]